MKHYAIITRYVNTVEPKYIENETVFYSKKYIDKNSKIKRIEHYNLLEANYLGFSLSKVKRAVLNTVEKKELTVYWKGLINQDVLTIGETLEINDELLTIEDVVKSVDGSVTYRVNDYFKKSNNYGELFEKCLIKYDNYEEATPSITYSEPEIEEKDNKVSWWKSLFKLG